MHARRLLSPAALVGLVGLAYSNAIFHPLLYDDDVLIVQNQAIRSLANVGDFVSLKNRWTRLVTHAVEYALVGLEPWLYHLDNVLFHAGVVLLVFALVRRIFGDGRLAWWTAALFAVHPVQTEVVAHVSGRRDLLAALFALASVLLLERWLRDGGLARLGGGLAALWLGVFSKEVAVVAPLALALVELHGRDGGVRLGIRDRLRAVPLRARMLYGGLALLALGFMGVRLFVAGDKLGLGGSPSLYETHGPGLGVPERVSLGGLGLRLLLFPVGQSVDYSFDALGLTTGGMWPLPGLLHVGLVFGAAVLTALGLSRRGPLGFAGVWFVLFWLPVAGIVPWHEVFAERFLYLPSIGFCLAAASAGLVLARSERLRRPATVAGILVLVLLVGGTIARNRVWGSAGELWQATVDRFPSCARAHKALGDVQLLDARPDAALEHYRAALRILPDYRDAALGEAAALIEKRRFGDALTRLENILERWPDNARALGLKGLIRGVHSGNSGTATVF